MTLLHSPREADVKRQVYALLRGLGATVYDLSQSRPSRVAAGIPDAFVFPPFGKAPFWYEAKRPSGTQRPEQRRFQEHCELSGMGYVLGGKAEIEAHLCQIGILYGDAFMQDFRRLGTVSAEGRPQ